MLELKQETEYTDYWVYNTGDVLSFKFGRWKFLKPRIGTGKRRGYKYVVFVQIGLPRKTFYVHRLVAKLFLGPCPEGLQVLHGSEGKLVNTVENLSYGTASENAKDRMRDGTQQFGEEHFASKLTESDVRLIRTLAAEGCTKAEISKIVNKNYNTIKDVVSRRIWKHVEEESNA